MTTLTPNQWARQAGVLYLILAPLGFFGLMYVPVLLLVANDAAASVMNIQQHELMYRLSILAAFSIQLVQLFIALALFQLFKSVHRIWALLIVLFTVAAMPIALLNELSRIAVLYFIHENSLTELLTGEQLNQAIMFLLGLNEDGIMIAHIFWGAWLLPMGVLIFKSAMVPKWIGVLMIIAFAGYVADTLFWILVPNETIDIAVYTFWGEIILPLWLVIKGVHIKSTTVIN